MPTLGKTSFELERIFRLLNNRFYGGELEKPIIAVQTTGKKSAYGWCTTRRIWTDSKNEQAAYYEITMTAEYLTRPNEQIVSTLLHEMAHLYSLQNGMKDTSRGCTYHNKTFKLVAESHGLTIEHDDKIGWSVSTLNGEALEYMSELKVNRQAFRIARQAAAPKGTGKVKQSMRKYICPLCGMTVRATKAVHVVCGDCMMTMETEDGESGAELMAV